MNIESNMAASQPLTETNYRPPLSNSGNASKAPSVGSRSAVAATQDATQSAAQPGLDQVQQAMNEVREAISPVAQNLLFSIDEDTGHTVVRVVDAETEEVIRQIPSEEILAIAKALDKLQGVLLKQEA